jgi:hypothetical protein
MTYYQHLKANIGVSVKCAVLSIFHLLHGVFPCKYTSHEFWKISLRKSSEYKND